MSVEREDYDGSTLVVKAAMVDVLSLARQKNGGWSMRCRVKAQVATPDLRNVEFSRIVTIAHGVGDDHRQFNGKVIRALCPRCCSRRRLKRMPHDPENAVRMTMLCEACKGGKDEDVLYFDKSNKLIRSVILCAGARELDPRNGDPR